VFRSEGVRQFEALLFVGIVCAGLLITRRRLVEALWILYFAHAALSSARHIPLFMIIASPIVAMEATRWWNGYFKNSPKLSIRHILHALSDDVTVGFRRTTFWIAVGLAPVIAITATRHWPEEFAKTFPIEMVRKHQDRIVGSRLFTSDQWGDYLLYKLWPKQKVFIDGRSDFYGESLGKEYLSLMHADFKWAQVAERYGFDLMMLPVKWPLASVLKLSPAWRVVADDGTAILFERTSVRPTR
jgi:hypothetical protein